MTEKRPETDEEAERADTELIDKLEHVMARAQALLASGKLTLAEEARLRDWLVDIVARLDVWLDFDAALAEIERILNEPRAD